MIAKDTPIGTRVRLAPDARTHYPFSRRHNYEAGGATVRVPRPVNLTSAHPFVPEDVGSDYCVAVKWDALKKVYCVNLAFLNKESA